MVGIGNDCSGISEDDFVSFSLKYDNIKIFRYDMLWKGPMSCYDSSKR